MLYKHNRGFTLIELLVVIAIIGILSSVVLASLNSARQKSRDAKRVSDVKQLQLALELYFDSNGGYPSTIGTSASSVLIDGGYIATIPTDPVASNPPYGYSSLNSGCTSYHLGATLEDNGHTVLSSDVDAAQNNSSSKCPDEGSSTSKTDFSGGGAQTNGDDATTPVYDVKP